MGFSIRFRCQKCGVKIEADESYKGNVAECPKCGNTVMIPAQGVTPGMLIEDFEIIKLLGNGVLGEVWLARQLSMNRKVTVKILSPALTLNPAVVARFMKEVKIAGKLNHPNIVTAIKAGSVGNINYLACDYVKGKDLNKILSNGKPLPEKIALRWAESIAQALKYAWDSHGIPHRDLNPRHIIIDGNNKPFVIDIGLSKTIAEDATITQTGLILGSPPFMSPEQLDSKKKLDCRSDIFSLGAVLYTMLTGSLPYEELNPANVFIKQLREPFPLVKEKNPGISEKACRLVEIMTARKRFYRQKDWDTAINDIQLVIKDKTPETRRPPRSSSNRQTAREHPRIKPENRPKTAKLYESGSSSRHSEARNNSSLYLIILLSVFLTVLLGVGLFLAKSRREEKDRLKREKEEAARLSAIHNKRRALTLKRLETKKRVKALKKWEKAVAYANSCIRQNGMYNKAIKKIEDVKIELAGTLYALKADKAIKILRKAREKNIHRTMKKLEDNARKFIEQKQFSRAAEIFANYTGPLADETLNHRKNREAFYNDRLSAFSLNKKKIQQRKIEKTREMLRKTAEFIYKGEIEKAIESIAGASGDEKIKNLEKSLKVLIERKKYIIDSFRKDLGQNIDIFLDDKLKKLKIKEVTDEKVYASEEIENGARMTYPLPLKDMTLEEKAGRLSAYDKTAAELYYGIISVKRRNFKMAETSFSKTGFISSPLIKILREEKNKRYQFDYPY